MLAIVACIGLVVASRLRRRIWLLTDLAMVMVCITFIILPVVASITSGLYREYLRTDIVFAVLAFWAGVEFTNRIYLARRHVHQVPVGRILPNLVVSIRAIPLLAVAICLGLTWLVRFWLLQYGMFFSGSATLDRVLSLPYPLVVLSFLTGLLTPILMVWAGDKLFSSRGSGQRDFAGAILAVLVVGGEFVHGFASGRRMLIQLFFMMAMPCLMLGGRRGQVRGALIGLAGIITMIQLSPFFLEMREQLPQLSEVTRFGQVLDVAGETRDYGDRAIMQERSRENVAARMFFVHRFVGDLLTAQETHGPMLGRNLLNAVASAIPRVLWPGKIGRYAPEQQILVWHEMPVHDMSSTWVAAGVADGGYVGAFFYGVLFGLLMFGLLQFVYFSSNLPLFLKMIFVGQLLHLAFNVESDMGSVFVMLRNMAILVLFFHFWRPSRMRRPMAQGFATRRPAEQGRAPPYPASRTPGT
ncbi:MAG TPA: hypothetical protein DCM68_05970 [Verrucomicrobia bacterium]|nr:hypothetical protein [Verrucomicrobiota bacterium]